MQGYRRRAGITQAVHPHLFRHQTITWLTSHGLSDAQIQLTSHGLSDAQIQLTSGHESKKSLEVYQHLARCWTISRRD